MHVLNHHKYRKTQIISNNKTDDKKPNGKQTVKITHSSSTH